MSPNSNLCLVSACKSGNTSNALYLLRAGYADINCSREDMTPLTAALSTKNTKLAIALLHIPRVNINMADTYGRTPLHFACCHNLIEIIRLLTTHPCLASQSLNKKDVYGRSPIMGAVELGKVEAVKEMIKINGVDLKTVNGDGESLHEVARNNGFPGISFLLQNIGRPQSTQIDVSVPALFVNLGEEHSSHHESLAPAFTDMNDLEDLEYQQEEAIQDLTIKHAQQTKKAKTYANTLEKMHENQKKEMRDLEQIHRQERLKAFSEMKAQRPILECPICLEDMAPPTKIFQCQSGHLVCGACHPRLSTCSSCKREFMGRAIGMEQFIRSLHKVE